MPLPKKKKPVPVHFHHPGVLEAMEKYATDDLLKSVLAQLHELRKEGRNKKFTKAGICLKCFLEGCSCRGEDVQDTKKGKKCRCCGQES